MNSQIRTAETAGYSGLILNNSGVFDVENWWKSKFWLGEDDEICRKALS